MREALEASLLRLGTDRVDLYRLHNPRMDAIDSDETFEKLEQLKAEGKIRHYGVALGPAKWREEGVRAIASREIASIQTVYNLLVQELARALIDAARRQGIGVMARVPTSSGLLDDNLTLETTFPEGDRRSHRPREWLVEGLQKIERIRFLCENAAKRTMAHAALRFILDSGATTANSTITREAELLEHAGAADVPELRGEELEPVSELYERNFDVEPVGA